MEDALTAAAKPLGKRRHGRELAMQFLYQLDVGGGSLEDALAAFWQMQPDAGQAARAFAEELIRGVLANRDAIDARIAQYTEHWDLPRLAAVDRNILRLAIYEMTCRDDIPPVVSINEAVDIAKKYSTSESGAFVNGILDRLRADLPPAGAHRTLMALHMADGADLHLHTQYSDGWYTPTALVAAAHAAGLAAIAVTDHDTLDGVPAVLAAGQAAGLEVIAGVEITAQVSGEETHLLGYFFGDTWRDAALQAALAEAKEIRRQRIGAFVQRLNELGLPLTVADVEAIPHCGTIGRLHIARALLQRGLVSSLDEAFWRYLKRGRPAYVERKRMDAPAALALIRAAGGVSVLAHPGIHNVDGHVPTLAAQGLDGIEVWHSKHSSAQTQRYQAWAQQWGLVATGGSDCHGAAPGEKVLLGTVRVPYECVTALRQRARRT